jgi:hypothetical protein
VSVVNPIVDSIADEIMLSVDDAAACSHRPEHVRRLFADANSRFLFARRIAARLGLPDGEVNSLDDMTQFMRAALAYCEAAA